MHRPDDEKCQCSHEADAGMVMNHAITISFATPHRTEETRCPAPAPMMLEETTCVVETGPPKNAAVEDDRGGGRLGAEGMHRPQPTDLRSHRLDNPPSTGCATRRDCARRNWQSPRKGSRNDGKIPRMTRDHGDDPHGLLGIIGPVAQGQTDGGDDLHLIEKEIGARVSPASLPR